MHDTRDCKLFDRGAERWTGTGLPADLNTRFDALGAEGREMAAIQCPSRIPWGGSKTEGVLMTFQRRIRGSSPPVAPEAS